MNSPQRPGWHDVDETGPPRLPVHALDSIGENHSRRRESCRNWHLERIAVHLVCNGHHDGEAMLVIRCGRQNQSRAPASLLMSRLRIEIDFDDVTLIRNVCRIYHTSLPNLVTNRLAPILFAMAIFGSDFLDQRF